MYFQFKNEKSMFSYINFNESSNLFLSFIIVCRVASKRRQIYVHMLIIDRIEKSDNIRQKLTAAHKQILTFQTYVLFDIKNRRINTK